MMVHWNSIPTFLYFPTMVWVWIPYKNVLRFKGLSSSVWLVSSNNTPKTNEGLCFNVSMKCNKKVPTAVWKASGHSWNQTVQGKSYAVSPVFRMRYLSNSRKTYSRVVGHGKRGQGKPWREMERHWSTWEEINTHWSTEGERERHWNTKRKRADSWDSLFEQGMKGIRMGRMEDRRDVMCVENNRVQ